MEDVNNTVESNVQTRGYLIRNILIILLTHGIIIAYISYVTYYYVSTSKYLFQINHDAEDYLNIFLGDTCTQDCTLTFCSSYGMLLFVFGSIYVALFYFKILKPYLGKFIVNSIFRPISRGIKNLFKTL